LLDRFKQDFCLFGCWLKFNFPNKYHTSSIIGNRRRNL
jgi:hypothetical protein